MAIRDIVQAAAGVGGAGEYIEDVFSTYLYKGTSTTQTITNGIDIAGEGGMVWLKSRQDIDSHFIFDTQRSAGTYSASKWLNTNNTNAEAEQGTYGLDQFNSDGFRIFGSANQLNRLDHIYASWSFRKSPKFFDVVTWAGNGGTGRAIPHSLDSTPGFIIVKNITNSADWLVWHRSLTSSKELILNTNDSAYNYGAFESATSTTFTVNDSGYTNQIGSNYVAYLFAHDAGGFGDDGEQNVISCGSYTGTGAVGNEVTLGFEPQWLLVKSSSLGENWWLVDVMRGMPVQNYTGAKGIRPNTDSTEATPFGLYPTATGFVLADGGGAINENNATYIYMAIRRPMKTPEAGTEVFAVAPRSSTAGYNYAFVSNFPVDMGMSRNVVGATEMRLGSRLQGDAYLQTPLTSAEASSASWYQGDSMNSVGLGFSKNNEVPIEKYGWMFKRAPGFMDVVCWTGDGTQNRGIAHNLTTTPEFVITKSRSSGSFSWFTYTATTGIAGSLFLNNENALNTGAGANAWGSTAFNESNFYISGPTAGYSGINGSGTTYIAYLFATLPGVSKVGSYTGTGADLNVDCGFSAGAKFILIKRTDSTGDWYVWDSARGIVAGDDPYLLLNSTAAQVTNTDYIDPLASGFTVTSSAPAALNASGGTYIFLAIA